MLLALLPMLFPSLLVHAYHTLFIVARHLSTHKVALDKEMVEYKSIYARKLTEIGMTRRRENPRHSWEG